MAHTGVPRGSGLNAVVFLQLATQPLRAPPGTAGRNHDFDSRKRGSVRCSVKGQGRAMCVAHTRLAPPRVAVLQSDGGVKCRGRGIGMGVVGVAGLGWRVHAK